MSTRPDGRPIPTGATASTPVRARAIEEEGGDAPAGSRPTKAHDMILRSFHFATDRSETLRAEILAVIDEIIEAAPSKPSEPDRCYGFRRKRMDLAGCNAEQIAGVAESKNGTSAILHNAIEAKTALQYKKDVPGCLPFPEERPSRRDCLGDLRTKESLQGRPSGVRSRDCAEPGPGFAKSKAASATVEEPHVFREGAIGPRLPIRHLHRAAAMAA